MVLNQTRASANLVEHRARARYFTDADGTRRLHSVQFMSSPVFKETGWEDVDKAPSTMCDKEERKKDEKNTAPTADKARRRAQKEVFELSLCNPDLDAFFTLTFSPEAVADRGNYEEVYKSVKVWFSNRVQRRGLKYVLVPERHKNGAIHFHGFCNKEALHLVQGINPHTGQAIFDKGQAVYNIEDWAEMGFSTCKIIPRNMVDRLRAVKYITKYINKGVEKIGGRYFLHGGALRRWEYEYGESAEDLTDKQPKEWWYSEGNGYAYTEYTYV